ncbi:immune inhibitor A [candidate division WOR-3 bacterium]|nr:immune inhibitor A [candidate division WOR-3 bacterium]
MKKLFVVGALFITLSMAQTMIVRVYVPTWEALRHAFPKVSLDIASGKSGEYYDLVVDHEGLQCVMASGVTYEVTVPSLEYERAQVRGSYCSYDDMVDSLQTMVANYPSICRMDSCLITTYLGRTLYCVKISDNPGIEEDDEPKFSIDGSHHSREWATPQAVLFFADSMLRSYGSVPEIAEIINTTEIYCFPIINIDGYDYDYPGGLSWRKNREPFGGSIGTDPNRNYGGGCNGEVDGYWGAADESQCSHEPSGQTFPGAYAFSGDEIQGYTKFIRDHSITTGFSLHSYGEQVMWAWGYTGHGTPDSLLYEQKGAYMASQMQRLSGGTYTPGQSYYNPYPTCGNTRDWVYGYSKWVAGLSALFYGSEIGTSFYQNQSQLDNISRQVFKAAKYLAGFADSLRLIKDGFVAPPQIYPLGTVGQNFTVYWHPVNAYDNNPTHWELVELTDLSVIEDNLESGTTRWVLNGFTLSTSQSHSSSHSFFSGNASNQNNEVRTVHPYLVQTGDSVTFWCYYNLETDYDVVMIEVSENGLEWFCLDDRFNGSASWHRESFSLSSWVGKSIYIRFRAMSDGSVNSGGFYVDDISPVPYFSTVTTVSSSIADTSYTFSSHPEGEFYYLTRGNNTAHGWGAYSCLEKVDVIVGITEEQTRHDMIARTWLQIDPNPFRNSARVTYNVEPGADNATIQIHDVSGSVVLDLPRTGDAPQATVYWDGTDMQGRNVPAGIYFVTIKANGSCETKKAILMR